MTVESKSIQNPFLKKPSRCDFSSPCLLFFDLDGTLLEGEEIPGENRQALLAAKAKGHRLFINSGRSKAHTPPAVFSQIPWDGMVCGSGYIELEGKVLQNRCLSPGQLREVISYAVAQKLPLVMEGVEHDYSVGCHYGIRLDTPEKREALIEAPNSNVTKITFLCLLPDPMVQFTGLRLISFPHYAEAILEGCTKATGMELICRTLGVELHQTVAFGDSANDRDMLLAAGCAVTMPDSSGGIETLAHLPGSALCRHGVSKALELLFGIK